jgi:8-oxo-dGTP pyrophosphatase MutT (NUDIX family)
MKKVERLREIAVYRHKYGTLFDDEVVGPRGDHARYARWHPAFPGIVVVRIKNGRIGLLKIFRYCIQQPSLELPRGLVDEGETPEQAATREMREEIGYNAYDCRHLGRIYADTGLISRHIDAFVCQAGEPSAKEHDELESIAAEMQWVTPEELREMIFGDQVRCGISLAGLLRAQAAGAFAGTAETSAG